MNLLAGYGSDSDENEDNGKFSPKNITNQISELPKPEVKSLPKPEQKNTIKKKKIELLSFLPPEIQAALTRGDSYNDDSDSDDDKKGIKVSVNKVVSNNSGKQKVSDDGGFLATLPKAKGTPNFSSELEFGSVAKSSSLMKPNSVKVSNLKPPQLKSRPEKTVVPKDNAFDNDSSSDDEDDVYLKIKLDSKKASNEAVPLFSAELLQSFNNNRQPDPSLSCTIYPVITAPAVTSAPIVVRPSVSSAPPVNVSISQLPTPTSSVTANTVMRDSVSYIPQQQAYDSSTYAAPTYDTHQSYDDASIYPYGAPTSGYGDVSAYPYNGVMDPSAVGIYSSIRANNIIKKLLTRALRRTSSVVILTTIKCRPGSRFVGI